MGQDQRQRERLQRVLADLDAADEIDPGKPGENDIALLDALPFLTLNLADAPEDLLSRHTLLV